MISTSGQVVNIVQLKKKKKKEKGKIPCCYKEFLQLVLLHLLECQPEKVPQQNGSVSGFGTEAPTQGF